jgi:hypothetical protein
LLIHGRRRNELEMPTNFVKGDVLTEAEGIAGAEEPAGKRALAFGVTSGIASAVKKRWPDFAKALDEAKPLQPGEVFAWRHGDLFIYALAIERNDGKPKVSWIERSLRIVIDRSSNEGVARILLPRLGGDWMRVKKLLDEIGATTTIDLVVFEQFVRKSATA